MEAVVSFRPFRVPKPAETQFFAPDDSMNRRFMEEDLARSGLCPDDMMAYTSSFIKRDGATAAYSIPYFGLDGKPLTDEAGYPVMYRIRFKLPEFSREQRYTQPSKEQLMKYELPSTIPYIHPKTLELKGDYIVCCEGEKKTAAVIKHLGIPAFGIGGCQMWRDPSGSGSSHPWIRKLLTGFKKIVIIPDGDVLRYDICNAYGTFAATLRAEGYEVELLNPPGKIDDLIVSWQEPTVAFDALPRLNPDALVQSSVSLAKRYNLAFKQNDKGVITVFQHTANVERLMDEHPGFPQIWKNLDNSRVMIGDKQAEPGLTDMQLANYCQYNLGMDKITQNTMIRLIDSQAKKNSRSPFLDYVKSQVWDGTPRLDSWMVRHWGVKDEKFTHEVSSKWMISACARMNRPGTKVDWILIVIGPQGIGKTTMPNILFRGMTTILVGEHNDKDLNLLFHSSLCTVFDELDSFGKKENTFLKGMITKHEDSFRPPYAPSVEVFPRRFSLYGCGNRYEFLQHDPSGYRRYPVLEATQKLNFKALEDERDQLWAEAWKRYQDGEKFWEIEGASEHAERYVAPNPMEDQIINTIEAWKRGKQNTNVKDGFVYFTMTSLLLALNMERDIRNTHVTREISAILRAIGAEQHNGSCPTGTIRGRYYRVPI